ncbi:MAG: hypothetical protein AAFV53_43725, partial [Myxococcota bacterium]
DRGLKHRRIKSPLFEAAQYAAEAATERIRREGLLEAVDVAEREARQLRAQNTRMQDQLSQLTATVARLSRLLETS